MRGGGHGACGIHRTGGHTVAVSAAPVHGRDFPDPFVLATADGYVAFGTNAAGGNVQALFSADLRGWRVLPDALPILPRWASPGFTWAPVVLARPGGYVMYYTVREPANGRQAISIAWSVRASGPYTDTSDGPFVYQLATGGSIDPSPFVDGDGAAYLVWKDDANAVGRPSSLWLQRLAVDGRSLAGRAVRLLSVDARWEAPLIEAPSIVRDGSSYYLFYSANWWNSDRYGIGYAKANQVDGPYTKVTTDQPWFASDRDVAGPGGQEWFVDRDGQLWMAYHGWQPGRVGYPAGARSLRLARVNFVDGRPVMDPGPAGPANRLRSWVRRWN